MNVDVNQLFDLLRWDSDEKDQQKGLEEAAKVRYLSIFIMPEEGKGYWDNCADILASRTDEELKPYLFSIFKWFRDGNWPGFMTIYHRFRKIPAKTIVEAYSFTIGRAQETNGIDSHRWLTWLSGLIRDQELLELLPKNQQELMKEYFKKWWAFQTDC